MAHSISEESVFAHRAKLYDCVRQGLINDEVLDLLLPNGEPIAYERQLWDYKLEIASLPKNRKASEEEKTEFNGAIAEVVKDVAALYNSHGGYIVIGVRNSPREIVGVTTDFDCDDLNKRVLAATSQPIECYYKVFQRAAADGSPKNIGLLFIPQRLDGVAPVQFIKDSPQKKSGKNPYFKGDIYFRFADQCIKAESSEDYAFLFTPGRRSISLTGLSPSSPVLDSNLGARDPAFIQFIGREDYLAILWKWFLDKFNSVKLLAGIGGVGKTAIAREFAEQVAQSAPFGFQKVVWLSAKRQFFTAISGRFVPSTRVDFASVDDLLREICLELGLNDDEVSVNLGRENLMEAAISALRTMPALVVVDDVDSLEAEQQQDVFHTLIMVFGQTLGKSPVGSRCLLTARLDLGAAPGQVIRVKGLGFEDFVSFIEITCEALELQLELDKNSKRMARFHRVTEGSPTFASSVLRLIALGEGIDQALNKWEGADGEDVRRFAFERELDQLPDSATNVLYAICLLAESTLVELSTILTRTEQQVRDDFSELRKYHLIVNAEAHLPGGARISVPGSIRMMRDALRNKVREPKRIETACAKARNRSSKVRAELGPQINRVVALWGQELVDDALELALILDRQFPDDSDVKCLLGRAYIRLKIPNYKQAEICFRKAQALGSKRPELLPLWVETKGELGDWAGLLEITKFTENTAPPPQILLSRFDAYKQLAEMERRIGSLKSAAERYLDAGKEIDRLFRYKKASGAALELKQLKKEFLTSHVELVDRLSADSNDRIDVWLAVVQCFECFVRGWRLVRLGAGALSEWWSAVERRDGKSEKSAAVLDVQLEKFRKILRTLREQDNVDSLVMDELEQIASDLDSRLSNYRRLDFA